MVFTYVTPKRSIKDPKLKSRPPSGGGGDGYLTKFNKGRLRPKVQPLTLIYDFGCKGSPFKYLLFEKGTPFAYLVQEVLFSFSN